MKSQNSTKKEERSVCFLSLPHESNTVREYLKKVVKKIGCNSYYIIESEGDILRNEIKRGIDNSSIIIADLSSSTESNNKERKGPRPAIMWEIGYAEANGLGLILICQNQDGENVPSVLKGYHVTYYELQNLEPTLKDIQNTINTVIARGAPKDTKIFRSKCFIDRKSADLEVRYLQATDTIKILELNLEQVADQVPTIKRALQNNVNLSVQILTLNPFSKWAEDRANQLAELPLRYRQQLYKKVKETVDGLSEINKDRWGLRIYDTFPTQIMFQIDVYLIHSIISLGKRSRNMLHFEVQNSQPNASDTFEAHFAQLWSSSDDYEFWFKKNETAVKKLLGDS